MTNNGYTPSFFDYSRTFLPQLPKNVKNRNMERSRQGLRTSSEEYGQFWNSDTQSRALPPIYLNDPTPETIAAASKWYRSPSSRRVLLPQNGIDDYVGSNFRHVVDFRRNGSHRNGYDLLGSAYKGNESGGGYSTDRPRHTDVIIDGDGALRPWSTYRRGSGLWSDADPDRARRHRYNLTIYDNDWQAPLTASLSDWKLADISQVDLQVHLQDNSVVSVPDIPFNVL